MPEMFVMRNALQQVQPGIVIAFLGYFGAMVLYVKTVGSRLTGLRKQLSKQIQSSAKDAHILKVLKAQIM